MLETKPTESTEEQESLAEKSAKNAMLEFLRLSEALTLKIGEISQLFNFKISVAESCTAGLLGTALTQLGGSSAWFMGGIISYSNEIKQKHLNVAKSTLESHGAVSALCVCQMAMGAAKSLETELALSISGIAGPSGGTAEKPVGTVWLGLCLPKNLAKLQKKYQKELNKIHNSLLEEHKTVISGLNMLERAFFIQKTSKLEHGNFIVQAKEFCFGADRSSIRQSAVLMSLYFLYQELIVTPE